MKTKNKISTKYPSKFVSARIVLLAFFATCFLLPKQNMAQVTPQCGMQLTNGSSCAVTIQLDYYDDCSGSSGPCETFTVLIPANTSTSSTCLGLCPNPLCNLVVTVLDWGGSPLPAGNIGKVDCGFLYSQIDSGTTTGCGIGTYNMQLNTGIFNISF